MEMNMEKTMHALNTLRSMEVIDISTGSRLGFIKDFVIDCEEYKVVSVIIPTQKLSWFSKESDMEIPWEKIRKVGVDVILIDGSDIIDDGEE